MTRSQANTLTRERLALALAAAIAMRSLSLQAKTDDRHRWAIYRHKARLVEAFWREGYCIAAEVHRPGLWHFVFAVGGYRFSWHLPGHEVAFEARPFQGPPQRLQHLVVDLIDSYEARMQAVRQYLAAVGG